jgi:hypothetical protein
MFKHEQTENSKINKKIKEVKLLTNYIPVKKANAHSNISEYETESSIQKNFSNKVQKNKNHIQAKSVQTTHNNYISPSKYLIKNKKENTNQRSNKSSRGSLYNLNNLNLGDYFSEKIIMTQQKFIDYKDNKINTLERQLSLIKKELNLYENKNIDNLNINSNNKKIIGNITKTNKSNSTDKNKKLNINNNIRDFDSKILCDNNYSNKILLGNNKSYISFNTFLSSEIINNNNNNTETADKKLKKHLSNLLTENNMANINIKTNVNINNINNININTTKHKNKKNKNKKNANKDMNKKNLLNMIYLSKKGCYNHTNNNYDHNTKIINIDINNNGKDNLNMDNNKGKIEEKEIKHDLHFYANTMKERQMVIKENLHNKKCNKKDLRMQNDLENLSEKINQVFNCFFDFYQKNNDKLK